VRTEKNVWLEGVPLFFVSVASKRLSHAVSLLFATLAGRSISVANKGLTWIGIGISDVPLPTLFLEPYDSMRVRGWWSANDMIPWELDAKPVRTLERGYV